MLGARFARHRTKQELYSAKMKDHSFRLSIFTEKLPAKPEKWALFLKMMQIPLAKSSLFRYNDVYHSLRRLFR